MEFIKPTDACVYCTDEIQNDGGQRKVFACNANEPNSSNKRRRMWDETVFQK